MKKNVLLRTNIIICIVIILGFSLTALISYRSNHGIFLRDVENISNLTSEGIYHRIDSLFTKPINISLTMANDNLLKSVLKEEEARGEEEDFVQTLRAYLLGYKEKYDYDSVFLVSTKTNRYYHFADGVDRILTEGNPENEWYYEFLSDDREYQLNIDNDEVQSANNEINIFINCKIFSPEGEVMGVVGIGFAVDTIQALFQEYEESLHLRAYLVDSQGNIAVSTTRTGYEKSSFFEEDCPFGDYREAILSEREKTGRFWYSQNGKSGFLVTCYVPNLEWHLIIDNNTSEVQRALNIQFWISMLVIALVVAVILLVVTGIIRRYNEQIVSLTLETEKLHQNVFQEETKKLYENIYEIDVTHNRAAGEATESYFQSLGVPKYVAFDKALNIIAEKQIKEEHREGYLQTFSPANVLRSYDAGRESLHYDFMTTNDGGNTYYWIRITARIFYWREDQSVRMLIYRQNIDREKRQELEMTEKMERDSLSGLYNKAATQSRACHMLMENPESRYAFFIMDIDNFKKANDTCGHAFGDRVIADFAARIGRQFRRDDVVGRIGGDEFVVFVPIPSFEWAEQKAQALQRALSYEFTCMGQSCFVSASIGVSISPEGGNTFDALYENADAALYHVKKNGKNGYAIYNRREQ